ncbi:MAG: site-specific integrase [Bacteroidota bacterium]
MKRNSFSILFFVNRTRPLKDGTIPICARITVNGERAQFVIQKSVAPDLWDSNSGTAKGNTKQAKEINNYLDLVKAKIKEHKLYLEEHNEPISAPIIKNRFMGIDNKSKTILEIYQEHNDKCKGLENIDFAPGTVKRYEISLNHVKTFIEIKYKKKDLFLYELNPMFISDFEYYLKKTKACGNNYTVKQLKNLKKIIRIALANKWMENDPFVNKKFHLENVDMAYLNEDELNRLMNKEFEIERLSQVKDIYLFCCFTGLAFVDVENLTNDELVEVNQQLWIKKKRQKTNNLFTVPLLEPAMKIINKYKDHPVCTKKGLVLPVMSNQRMNSYLKEIADLCTINKNLSTHTARHTFATTVTLTNNVSIEVVSKMLGHTSIKMTQKYARVVDDLISKDMNKLNWVSPLLI